MTIKCLQIVFILFEGLDQWIQEIVLSWQLKQFMRCDEQCN